MPGFVPVCIWCQKRLHYHCDGLRFTASGIPFKASPLVACSCKVCDHIKERWIYCDRCKTNIAIPEQLVCHTCQEAACKP